MVLWFYGSTASHTPSGWAPASHTLHGCAPLPRTPPLGGLPLRLARTGFHDLLGILKPFLSTGPAPWRVWTPNFVGLSGITRAIYHTSLGDVLSMVTEICRIVPKWSPTPVPPPPSPGLTFRYLLAKIKCSICSYQTGFLAAGPAPPRFLTRNFVGL